MKSLSIIVFLLTVPLCSFAHKKKAAEQPVKAQARIMAKAFLEKNYNRYAEFAFPQSMTDVERGHLSDHLQTQIKSIEASGSTIVALNFGTPSPVIKKGNLWECTLPEETVSKLRQGTIKDMTTLIAVSYDRGKHWYFMDASDRKIGAIAKQYPEISTELIIGPAVKPVFEAGK